MVTEDLYVPLQVTHGQDDGWRVLVICLLLNLTSRDQVRPMLDTFFERFPGPTALTGADESEIHELVRPLGLAAQRTTRLLELSWGYLMNPPESWRDVLKLKGCGMYAAESYRVFVEHDIDLDPGDYVVREWVEHLRKQGDAAAAI